MSKYILLIIALILARTESLHAYTSDSMGIATAYYEIIPAWKSSSYQKMGYNHGVIKAWNGGAWVSGVLYDVCDESCFYRVYCNNTVYGFSLGAADDGTNLLGSFRQNIADMNFCTSSAGALSTDYKGMPSPVDLTTLQAWGDNTRLPGINFPLGAQVGSYVVWVEADLTPTSWAGYAFSPSNGNLYWIGCGDAYYDYEPAEIPCEILGTCPSPTPTPSPTPIPSPTPTSNPYPMPSATFTPDVITSTGTGTVTSEGTFSYDEVTGMGTITTTSNISITVDTTEEKEYVDIPSEIYEIDENYEEITSNIPLSGGGDAASYTDAVSDYIGVADGVVDDVSGSAFQPVANWILDTVFLHPMMDFFGDISFDVHDALCSVSWEFQGYTIAFSFCDLESSLLILRYVIIGVSYVYGILIVIKGD